MHATCRADEFEAALLEQQRIEEGLRVIVNECHADLRRARARIKDLEAQLLK